MTTPSDLAELVRAPGALSALGDTLVGATAARGRVGARALTLPAASACLYAAGMALNDYADADLDAVERPERPIPSGRVSRDTALAVGAGLTAAGLVLARIAGRAPGRVAPLVAAAVWTYDLAAKNSPAGPAVMAACRGLDVLMGAAGPGWRRALPAAAVMTAHTGAVTVLSRGEVHGTTSATAVGAATVTGAAALATVAIARPGAGGGAVLGAAAYGAAVLPAQVAAAAEPTAEHARTATRNGIRAMVPLQAALVARTGGRAATAALVVVELAGRLLARARTRGDLT